ncbi:MAG: GTP-binding protein Era-like-protein [Gemmatimonadetes bacterium]|nr:GTP-binding protein Era-like-protein [Gemmatimonadota bacterium]
MQSLQNPWSQRTRGFVLSVIIFPVMPNAGIVTVVGKPNAGKSTLLNRIVGEKLSIVSPKPQSTRDRIVGILTTGSVQMILLDTPGLLNPKYPLQEAMRGTALSALNEADVVLYLVDGTEGPPAPLAVVAQLERPLRAPVVTVINKTDLIGDGNREDLVQRHPDAVLVSAATGDGVEELLVRVGAMLPESPFLYPDDEISTQTVRFFVSELVRETALEQLDDEVPYSVACEIEEFREGQSPVYIRAVLHVERDSQKQILIGAGGQRVKTIGRAAREKIEAFIGARVYLDLWVKVLANWRRNPHSLHRFGYQLPPASSPTPKSHEGRSP